MVDVINVSTMLFINLLFEVKKFSFTLHIIEVSKICQSICISREPLYGITDSLKVTKFFKLSRKFLYWLDDYAFDFVLQQFQWEQTQDKCDGVDDLKEKYRSGD